MGALALELMMNPNHLSAVHFANAIRPHIALAVSDIDAAVRFYSVLLDAKPVKLRSDYAKFETTEPPLNLSLNLDPQHAGQRGAAHFGLQVQSTAHVLEAAARLDAATIATDLEESRTCCYAVQDKVWARDPDGHRWEVFVVTEADAAVHSSPVEAAVASPTKVACCVPNAMRAPELRDPNACC